MMVKRIANFLFESSAARRVKRTGWQVLGVDGENVAEHSWHAAVIGYVLAKMTKVDNMRVVLLLLFHDIEEVRVGDVNKLQGLYVNSNHYSAINDQTKGLPFAKDIVSLTQEFQENTTTESKIAHDADVLALLVRLKELVDKGDNHAKDWFQANRQRLRLAESKKLASGLWKTDSQEWWVDVRKTLHNISMKIIIDNN